MAGRKNGLGRGLDALFPEKKSAVKEPVKKTTAKTENKTVATEKETTGTKEKSNTAEHKKTAMIVKISSVEPNVNQPRKQFDEDALLELSESIKQYGVLQPLLVSDKKDYYEIIAGERRWRAAKLAGLKEVPVIVKDNFENFDASSADIYNVESSEGSSVANEDITTSTIAVIGGNGTVTVKGAEGKKVVINNVLGQAVANTVIISSEATISVPAGVVFVAVEGEAAVKAIVK